MDNKTLTEKMADKMQMAREDVAILIDTLADVIESSMLEQDTIAIPGFGNFEPRKRDERIAVHPSTGKRMLYPPKLSITFKPSALLKKMLRNEV